ncbi:hypothetical protein V1L52_05685 [Treponema sp. HNW]|uniref:hypothetical protein n=1 Tax=Treponema sp. HNW TaxID=3116654 RepID=UPI003D12329C
MNIYKTKVYRILLNCIYGFFAAAIIAFIVSRFSSAVFVGWLIFFLALAVYFKVIIVDNIMTVTLDEKTLTVKKGKKTDVFPLDKVSFRAKIVSSRGENACTLYAVDSEGKETKINCELIGIAQFEDMLEKLGVTGDKSPATKLDTIEKNN